MSNVPPERESQDAGETPPVDWDASEARSSHCNVANALPAPGGVLLNFGASRSPDGAGAELAVELLHRVVLTPFAAQRLEELLIRVIRDYESVHGEVK